jgi:hypothetical protein
MGSWEWDVGMRAVGWFAEDEDECGEKMESGKWKVSGVWG